MGIQLPVAVVRMYLKSLYGQEPIKIAVL